MKLYLHRLIHLCILCAVVILTCGSIAAAQEPDFDDLAKRLSNQIAKAGISSVVVADFVNNEGETSPEGHYLAGELSQGLDNHKKNFVVADLTQLFMALSQAQLLPKDLTVTESLQRIGSALRVDAVVTGILEATAAKYSVTVSLRGVKDGDLLGSGYQSVDRPAIADGIVFLASKALPERLSVAGQGGVGIPTCEYCPAPVYSDEARKAKLQGNVVLVVIVNLEGRAGKTVVTKTPDAGLAKQATEALKNWRFKPATNKEGKPVSVLVPIEMTFRLH
jgi:TonB family protein